MAIEQLLEGRMALDEHIGVQRNLQLSRELRNSVFLMQATTVGEEDERDGVLLEERKGSSCMRKGFGAAK